MSVKLNFGSYEFPSPTPLISIQDSPIYYSNYHTYNSEINVIGQLTGCSFSGLCASKEAMVTALLEEGIANLLITGADATYPSTIGPCEINTISFSETNPIAVWPYDISFRSINTGVLAAGFNITDPTNSWQVKEGKDNTLEITHSVSARGIITDNNSKPLDYAKSYVEDKLVSPNEYIAALLFEQNTTDPILISDSEEIDEINNTYGRTLNYKAGKSQKEVESEALIRFSVDIQKNVLDFAVVSIKGSINGGMLAPVTESMFSESRAYSYAKAAYDKSKQSWLGDNVNVLNSYPMSFEYSEELERNLINFSFEFTDDPRNEKAALEYTVSRSIDDRCFATVSINGSIVYMGMILDQDTAFQEMEDKFASTNFYAIAREFYSNNGGLGRLRQIPESQSLTKSKTDLKIDFDFTYNDKLEIPLVFQDFEYSTSTDHPVPKIAAIETITGYCLFEKAFNTIGKKQLNGGGIITGDMAIAENYIDSIINFETPVPSDNEASQPFVEKINENFSVNTGDGSFQFGAEWVFNFELC